MKSLPQSAARVAAYYILNCLLAVFIVEVLQRQAMGFGVGDFIEWSRRPHFLLVNMALAMSLLSFLALFFRPLSAGLLFFFVMFIFGFTNAQKLKWMGQPFYFTDIVLVKQLSALQDISVFIRPWSLICVFLLLCLGVFFGRRAGSIHLASKRARTVVFGVSFLFAAGCFLLSFGRPYDDPRLRILKLDKRNWYPAPKIARQHGFLVASIIFLDNARIAKPEGYSADKIADLVAEARRANPRVEVAPPVADPSAAPNVVAIMSEAFWDPRFAEQIHFEQPPLPDFGADKNFQKSVLISPTFFGQTHLTEFEFLSGHPTAFLPPGSVPFQDYLSTSMNTLPAIFKKHGYQSIAIHPADPNTWNRLRAYPRIGFDKFLTGDDFDPVPLGFFVEDMAVTRRILDVLRDGEKPTFLFVVTMQNHSPYFREKDFTETKTCSEPEVKVAVAPENLQELKNYSKRICASSHALEALVAGLKGLKRETVLIFFGDHIPRLDGTGQGIFSDLKLMSGSADEKVESQNQLFRYQVPLYFWTNRSRVARHRLPPTIGAHFLGTFLLQSLDFPTEDIFEFDRYRMKELIAVNRNFALFHAVDKDPVFASLSMPAAKAFPSLWTMTYDVLFGSGYSTSRSK